MDKDGTDLSLYFIAGTQDVPAGMLPQVLETALQAGITCFQYREKGKGSLVSETERTEMALRCQAICESYSVPFIINDEIELALAISADGIHVGQEDRKIQEVLSLFPDKIVGLSCTTIEEVAAANSLEQISYYGLGPVFGTLSKADAKPAVGVEKLAQLVKLSKKPSVAIGGISMENIGSISASGVDGAAVISAITRAEDIFEAVKQLKHGRNKNET